ncbi:Williams-Beuren syndrome chromosomal region 27 protein-like isoform X2 [Mizuhopecten yessoensis]|uniref:Williams-Beuren syndrome chromosomal region 27 protein-like isoform X2 n=1 Tax=Mizuhopecten yessoensis TaxID=6573 RepID=UPI000B45E23F|nr:Williams-Beuren syndrome chromosomal region 27 protein-like isoform X2 [Mizuhopecten yessoensis]
MDPAERCFEGHTQTKTREEKTQFYDSWSKQYEEDMHTVEYRGPAIVADVLAELYPGTRENVCILDVAAGTGLVGVELAKQGFVKVDALDPSQGMLDEAKTKGVYQKMICSYFDEKELNIEPGGYFVMATRPTQLNTIQEYKGHLEPLMDEIEKEGKWEKVR